MSAREHATITPISIKGFKPPVKQPDPGPAPDLRWIDIDDLYVDAGYQREIRQSGHRNILAIAQNFDWAFFAPIVVATVGGEDFFLIVDGQHRATAAKLIGIRRVPCAIIAADAAKQARAFVAINGMVTAMGSLQRFKARLAAGERDALRTDRVASGAGVKILRGNPSAKYIGANETTALLSIERGLREYGERVMKAALAGILASAKGRQYYLQQPIITAVARVLAGDSRWVASPRLTQAFEAIDLREALATAKATKEDNRGHALADFIDGPLVVHLEDFFAAEQQPAKQGRGA